MMTMDEPRRCGLDQLDPAQLGGLSEAQRDAIARAIVAQAPALMRQGNAQRFLRGAFVGGAVAAAAAMLFMFRGDTEEPEHGQAEVALVAHANPRACVADAAVTPVQRQSEGLKMLEIGTRMRAVASLDSELSIVSAEACNTRLRLTRGTLTLSAPDLGGGALSVDTPHGQVQVTGTLFRVSSAAAATTVSVVEGGVVVKRLADGAEKVNAGQRLTIGAGPLARESLSSEEQEALRDALRAPTRVPVELDEIVITEPAQAATPKLRSPIATGPSVVEGEADRPSASALLAQAESLWRKGDREAARTAFRAAAEDPGAAGEAAWVRLARLELSQGSAGGALSALEGRKQRRSKGVLGAEASWLEVQALQSVGRKAEALQAAQALLREYPNTPQANAAQRLVRPGND